MENCCHNKQKDLEAINRRHKWILWIVLLINLVMFGVEIYFGMISNSLALVADSLDMLGDAITYGSSLLVVGMSIQKKSKVAKLKAWIMLVFGLSISAKCIYSAINPSIPDSESMLIIGLLALGANTICLFLLTRHRDDDINMKSVWICSRNDIIANLSVLLAGFAVFYFETAIPDVVVGVGLAILFTRSALGIFREANETVEKVSD